MVVKTGVSLPDEVYRELTRIAKLMGYTSISKAVRDAIETFIAFNRWWVARGRVVGVLQVLLPSEKYGRGLVGVEKQYSDVVRLSLHIPINGYSLILIIVEGDGERVKQVYKEVTRIDGVLAVQANLLPAPVESKKD